MEDRDDLECLTMSESEWKSFEEEFEVFQREVLIPEKEKSRKEGREETQRNIIVNLNKENISLDIIAEVSNLSLDEVKNIINTCSND